MNNLYYVGLDVHKESIVMSVLCNTEDRPLYEKSVAGDGKGALEAMLRLKEKGEVYACYESGCMGFTLQRYLASNDINCVIAATSKILRKPGEHIKTDTRDARKLARQLRSGEVTAINIPTAGDEAVRDYLRTRDDIKDDLKRTKKRLLQFILRNGYRFESRVYWTGKHKKWMKALPFRQEMQREAFESYYQHMEALEDRLHLMDERIQEISQTDTYREHVNFLRCFKGIDYLTSLAVIVEVGDFRRFKEAEGFMSFLGLVPCEDSSGDKRSQGSITKSGNGHLRKLLIESSWHYRYPAPAGKRLDERRKGQSSDIIAYTDKALRRLQKKYAKLIHRGKSSQVAVTAVARELAGFIWGLMVGKIF